MFFLFQNIFLFLFSHTLVLQTSQTDKKQQLKQNSQKKPQQFAKTFLKHHKTKYLYVHYYATLGFISTAACSSSGENLMVKATKPVTITNNPIIKYPLDTALEEAVA